MSSPRSHTSVFTFVITLALVLALLRSPLHMSESLASYTFTRLYYSYTLPHQPFYFLFFHPHTPRTLSHSQVYNPSSLSTRPQLHNNYRKHVHGIRNQVCLPPCLRPRRELRGPPNPPYRRLRSRPIQIHQAFQSSPSSGRRYPRSLLLQTDGRENQEIYT